jgi:hypothetical protein
MLLHPLIMDEDRIYSEREKTLQCTDLPQVTSASHLSRANVSEIPYRLGHGRARTVSSESTKAAGLSYAPTSTSEQATKVNRTGSGPDLDLPPFIYEENLDQWSMTASAPETAPTSTQVLTRLPSAESLKGFPADDFGTNGVNRHNVKPRDTDADRSKIRTPQMIMETRRLRHNAEQQRKIEEERRRSVEREPQTAGVDPLHSSTQGNVIDSEVARVPPLPSKTRIGTPPPFADNRGPTPPLPRRRAPVLETIPVGEPSRVEEYSKGTRAQSRAQTASVAHVDSPVPGNFIDSNIALVETILADLKLGQTASDTTTHLNTPLVPPNLDHGQSLASRLNSYFTGRDVAQSSYSDNEIQEISGLLKHHTPRWCKTPRTYVILRTIDSLDLLDECIDIGFSDYWLPVTEKSLPEFLRPSVRSAFVDAQTLVLTKSLDLEKGTKGQHCYFRKGETLPLETKGILGSGGYGQVDRVLSLISFKEYARKRVLRSAAFRGRRKEDVKQFIAEIEILKRLKHRHVVEFVGSYTDAKYIGLIMTPIAEGDLTTYMSSAKPVNYPELRTFFGCLATGLEFLHQHNVRHKDIKPGNILVHSGQVLFTDFGLSLDFTDATGSTTMSMVNGMTPRYCAPEVANYEPRNTMSDVWCLGVVFLEMVITLKGETNLFMDDYFRQHGSGQAFIRFNTGAMPAFTAHLVTLGHWVDNKPLEWIEPMLLEEQKLRPTASALVNQITTSITIEGSSGFCGICCMLPEEEDFSDYASDV